MVRFICGDVGGTNCRLQLFESLNGEEFLLKEQTLSSKAYPSLSTAVLEFLKEDQEFFGDKTRWPQVGALALAGPVVNNTCQFTNIGWSINGEEMQQLLRIEKVTLMNDFVGLAYGLLALKEEDRIILNDVEPSPTAPIACLGAGTGLGEVFLTHDGKHYIAWPTEGGHSDLSSTNPLDYQFIEWLRKRHRLTHISAERLISGTGISNIFDFFCDKFPEQVKFEVKEDFERRGAAAVTERALQQSDELCIQAINMFARSYAEEAGNLALKTLPFGGMYVAGGIAPKMIPILTDRHKFMDHFFDKGRLQPLMQKIPLYIVTHKEPGLLGARVIARRLLNIDEPSSTIIPSSSTISTTPSSSENNVPSVLNGPVAPKKHVTMDVSPSPSIPHSLSSGSSVQLREPVISLSLPPNAFGALLSDHHQSAMTTHRSSAPDQLENRVQETSSSVESVKERRKRRKVTKKMKIYKGTTLFLLSSSLLLTSITAGVITYTLSRNQ